MGSLAVAKPIGKVAIEVDAVGIVATGHAATVSFVSLGIAIRIHRWHDVDSCGINKVGHLVINAIIVAQILDKVEERLTTSYLIPMHIPNVLELRLAWFMDSWIVRDLHHS